MLYEVWGVHGEHLVFYKEKTMVRNGLVFALAAMMTVGTATTALAAEWKLDNVGWWWQNDDGSYPVNCWEWLDGNKDGVAECYYFCADGYMLAATTTLDGYTVNADGAWDLNGAVQTKATDAVSTSETTEAASGNNVATITQSTDDYSGTYVDTWSDGTVVTHVLTYDAASQTITDARSVGGSTYADIYKYAGIGWNNYTCFELVSDTEKDSIFFSAPGVLETGYSTMTRQ